MRRDPAHESHAEFVCGREEAEAGASRSEQALEIRAHVHRDQHPVRNLRQAVRRHLRPAPEELSARRTRCSRRAPSSRKPSRRDSSMNRCALITEHRAASASPCALRHSPRGPLSGVLGHGGAAGDQPCPTASPDGGVPPLGGASTADLRGRPARVPNMPRPHADRRVHHPDVGDRPDSRALPHARHTRGARRAAEPPIDGAPASRGVSPAPRAPVDVTSAPGHPAGPQRDLSGTSAGPQRDLSGTSAGPQRDLSGTSAEPQRNLSGTSAEPQRDLRPDGPRGTPAGGGRAEAHSPVLAMNLNPGWLEIPPAIESGMASTPRVPFDCFSRCSDAVALCMFLPKLRRQPESRTRNDHPQAPRLQCRTDPAHRSCMTKRCPLADARTRHRGSKADQFPNR